MKKDIKFLPVEGITVAVAKEVNEINEPLWNVYLLNRNNFPIESVFVRSKGYGMLNDEKQETSVLRHQIPHIGAGEYALIEPIDSGVFHLSNEYWVSYFAGNQIYDKKFIFLLSAIIIVVALEVLSIIGIHIPMPYAPFSLNRSCSSNRSR